MTGGTPCCLGPWTPFHVSLLNPFSVICETTVAAGALPGMVSGLARLLQMPVKMAESLVSKNPTLQSITVIQVSPI